MNAISTFREMFRFDDWSRDLLLDAASRLDDAQLDRPLEIGCGSIRTTLIHLHEAQLWWVWMCMGEEATEPPASESIDALQARWRETAARRDAWLDSSDESVMAGPVEFTDRAGAARSHPVSDVLLHVINHGAHHRAQANNMLRQLGAAPCRVDYIFMRFQSPAAPAMSGRILRDFYAYCDWAQAKVLASARLLSDAQLDRTFDMGIGTLRTTLAHITAAERWWFGNWKEGSTIFFPNKETSISIDELVKEHESVAAARDAFIARLSDDDLSRRVDAQPRKDVLASFPLGQTMVQLCCHGTYHRAQALNMLRHAGAEPMRMDYLVMCKEKSLRA